MLTGKRIKERRRALGLSADDLAEKLGKNRATIYRYESDEIENFPLSIIEPLAEVLMTTPAYLMGWTDDPSDTEASEPSMDDDVWEIREALRNNPELQILFRASHNATAEDLLEAAELIKARKTIRNITNRK